MAYNMEISHCEDSPQISFVNLVEQNTPLDYALSCSIYSCMNTELIFYIFFSDLTRTLSKLEERISKRERIIEEKANDIDKLQKKIQALEGVSILSSISRSPQTGFDRMLFSTGLSVTDKQTKELHIMQSRNV